MYHFVAGGLLPGTIALLLPFKLRLKLLLPPAAGLLPNSPKLPAASATAAGKAAPAVAAVADIDIGDAPAAEPSCNALLSPPAARNWVIALEGALPCGC
jgi:hypothetical protein